MGTLCDTDRDGPGRCDSLTPDHKSAAGLFLKLVRRAVLTKNPLVTDPAPEDQWFNSPSLQQRVTYRTDRASRWRVVPRDARVWS